MKILWFTNIPCNAIELIDYTYYGGGWLSSLERELIKQKNIQLSICFYSQQKLNPFSYKKTTYYPIYRKYSKFGKYIKRLFTKINNNKLEIPKLISVIKTINPDIIHIHGTEDNFGLIQNYSKTPIIISIQGILNPYLLKYYSGIPSQICNKYENVLNKILLKSNKSIYKDFKIRAYREKEILKMTKYIIGRTDWDRRVMNILSPESKYYIGQEILRPSFYNNYWNKSDFNEKISIVTITSEILYKGFETILRTSIILKTYTNLNFEWIIIGINNTNSIVKIIQKWNKTKPEKWGIKLLGKKNEIEIKELLLKSDIYCQVSHIENSPNSLCEAMLLGLPIIATNAGGTTTMLNNNIEGLIVQEGEPFSLAGAIIELKNDFKKAQYYAKNAREKAKIRHNKETVVKDLMKIYNTCIQDYRNDNI